MIFTGGKKSTIELGEMLQLLVKQRAPDLYEELKNLLKDINKAFVNRGVHVHSVWTVGDCGAPFIGKFFSEKTPKSGKLVKLDELEAIAMGFSDLEGRLCALVLERFAVGIAVRN